MSEIPVRLSTALADRYRIERELGAGKCSAKRLCGILYFCYTSLA